MKKRLAYGLVIMSLLLVSCKLTIYSFTAPSTANTGDVITLTIQGNADSSGGECGLVLEIPTSWQVLSAGTTDGVFLSEKSQYASLYTATSSRYKIWVGTTDTDPSSSGPGQDITATVKILVGSMSASNFNYTIKVATGAFRNGAWVTDDPVGRYNFATIAENTTGSKYVNTISVKNTAGTPLGDIGQLLWAKRAGASMNEYVNDIATDKSGNVYVAGYTTGSSITFGSVTITKTSGSSSNLFFIVKYDSNGNVVWATKASSGAEAITLDETGNIYATTAGGVLAKFDSAGNELWKTTNTHNYDHSGSCSPCSFSIEATDIAIDSNGKGIMTGIFSYICARSNSCVTDEIIFNSSNGNPGGKINLYNLYNYNDSHLGSFFYVLSYDKDGNTRMFYTGGLSEFYTDFYEYGRASSFSQMKEIRVTLDNYGNKYFVKHHQESHGDDSYLEKYTSGGRVWSTHLLNNSSYLSPHTFCPTINCDTGGVDVVEKNQAIYTISKPVKTLADCQNKLNVLTKYDTNGNEYWRKILPLTPYSIAADDSGNIYAAGGSTSSFTFALKNFTNQGNGDIYLLKYDKDGKEYDAVTIGNIGDDVAKKVVVDSSGNVYIAGHYNSTSLAFNSANNLTNSGGYDMFIAKIRPNPFKFFMKSTQTDISTPLHIGIIGGTPPFTVVSSNPKVAIGIPIEEDVIAVSGLSVGTATFTIIDSKNSQSGVDITITDTLPSQTTAHTDDVNEDGKIGLQEVIYVLQSVSQLRSRMMTTEGPIGDLDKDGKVDLKDAIYGLRAVTGITDATIDEEIPSDAEANLDSFDEVPISSITLVRGTRSTRGNSTAEDLKWELNVSIFNEAMRLANPDNFDYVLPDQRGLAYSFGQKDYTKYKPAPGGKKTVIMNGKAKRINCDAGSPGCNSCPDPVYGLDCSGFVYNVFKKAGINIPSGNADKQRSLSVLNNALKGTKWSGILKAKNINAVGSSDFETGDIIYAMNNEGRVFHIGLLLVDPVGGGIWLFQSNGTPYEPDTDCTSIEGCSKNYMPPCGTNERIRGVRVINGDRYSEQFTKYGTFGIVRYVPGLKLKEIDGNGQTGIINTPLYKPIKVMVLDGDNQPVIGENVKFEWGKFGENSYTVTTDTSGIAEMNWTLENYIGEQQMTVSCESAFPERLLLKATAVGSMEPCSAQTNSGKDIPDTHSYHVGGSILGKSFRTGTFKFEYNVFEKKDRIKINYEGKEIYDSGCVSGIGSVSLLFTGFTDIMTVNVLPNCEGTTGTDWNYTVYCAE